MIVERSVNFQVLARLPNAQPGPAPQPPPGNLTGVDWKTLADAIALRSAGGTLASATVPGLNQAPRWPLRDPAMAFTAKIRPSDSPMLFANNADLIDFIRGWKPVVPDASQTAIGAGKLFAPSRVAAAGRDWKPIAAETAQLPPEHGLGDIPIKRIVEACGGLLVSRSAYQTLYFSNTVPPDQLAALLQNYGALTPHAAQAGANTLLSCLSSPAGHAVLYGLMMTGGGIFLLQATREKPTLSLAYRWGLGFFAAGVLLYLGMRYLGWAW